MSDQHAIKISGIEGLTETENVEEAKFTRIIKNKRGRPDYVEGKVYEMFYGQPSENFPNGERYIISEIGRQDFGWLFTCQVEFYK